MIERQDMSRSQTNINSLSKRCREDKDKEKMNAINGLQLSSKRPKMDTNLFAINNNSNSFRDLNSLTNGLNELTTSSPQDMRGNSGSSADPNGDPFDDDLDDLLSQAAEHPISTDIASQQTHRFSDQNMPTQTVSDEELMHTMSSRSSNSNSDVKDGRIKILESIKGNLTEEVNRLKTQVVQYNTQIRDMREDCNQKIADEKRKRDAELAFERNERQHLRVIIDQLQRQMDRESKTGKRTPVVFANDLIRQRNNCPNFSHLRQQFFEPLAPLLSSTQSNKSSSGSVILVPESQPFKEPMRLTLSANFPSEIPATQLSTASSSLPIHTNAMAMDTDSQPIPDHEIKISQSQELANQFTAIRPQLEAKYRTNCQQMKEYFFDQQMDLFPNQWLSEPNQTNELSAILNDLALELQIKTISQSNQFQFTSEPIH